MTNTQSSAQQHERQIMLYAGILFLVFNVVSFLPSFFLPLTKGQYNPPSVWLIPHAVACFAWLVILPLQARFAVISNFTLHKWGGIIASITALTLVLFGWLLQYDLTVSLYNQGRTDEALISPSFRVPPLLVFGLLVLTALWLRKKSDWHMRLMVIATLFIMQATSERFYFNVVQIPPDFVGPAIYSSHLLALIILMLVDKITLKKVHPVYKIALLFSLLLSLFTIVTATMPFMLNFWKALL